MLTQLLQNFSQLDSPLWVAAAALVFCGLCCAAALRALRGDEQDPVAQRLQTRPAAAGSLRRHSWARRVTQVHG